MVERVSRLKEGLVLTSIRTGTRTWLSNDCDPQAVSQPPKIAS